MDYEKKYNEALERARANYKADKEMGFLENCDMLELIFPELRESDDERIRNAIVHLLEVASEAYLVEATGFKKEQFLSYLEKQKESLHIPESCKENADSLTSEDERIRMWLLRLINTAGYRELESDPIPGRGKVIAWLEKHKEQPKKELGKYIEEDNLVYRLNWVLQDFYKAGKDDEEREHRFKCYKLFWDSLEDANFFEQKEQKPTAWGEEDEKMLADTIFKLAGFMGSEKNIDWLKSRCLQPKQEWSEEDEHMIWNIISIVGQSKSHRQDAMIEWLKSLRPSWKPSEEQMNCLCAAVDAAIRKHNESVSGYKPARVLKSLYEDLKKL